VPERDVDPARALPDRRVGHGQVLDDDVPGVGELAAGRDANVAGPGHRPADAGHPDVVAVLDQDRVAAGVGDVDPLDHRAAALGDAEDAPPAAACDHLTDHDVGGVAVADPAVAVGHPEGGVTGAGAGADRVHRAHSGVDGVVEHQPGEGGVAGHHGTDGQPVHTIGLHTMVVGPLHVDVVDADIGGTHAAVAVVVDADTQPAAQPQLDLSQVDVAAVAYEDAEPRGAGDGEVGHLDVVAVADPDHRVVPGRAPGHVDGAARLEHGVAGHVDALVPRHAAGVSYHHPLG